MSPAPAERPSYLWPVQDPPSEPGLLSGGPVLVNRTGPAHPVEGSAPVEAEPWPLHCRLRGPRPRGGLWLVDVAASARLSGRGGGFFPAEVKWRSALFRPGRVTVVANAAESETLSAKDATLLRLRPHLVLDGLATLCETLEARSAVLWMHDTDSEALLAVREALRERQRAGLDEPPVSVRAVHGSYLSGESSAIKQALEGGPQVPRFQGAGRGRGRGGQTTVVHNVETLARLSLLSREAAPGARPEQGPGNTRLLSVLTPRDRRVVEVPAGTRLGDAVTWAAGGQPAGDAAVLLAGFGGMWARWADVAGCEVDESALRSRGFSLGAGIVAPLWTDACGVSATAAIAAYLARASARQCGPCLFGLPALAGAMARLRDGTARRSELAGLRRDLAAVDGRGACHHPDGAVRLLRSALDVFGDDVRAHAAGVLCGRPGDPIPVPEA